MQKIYVIILNSLLIVHSSFGMEESLINVPKMMLLKELEDAIWDHNDDQCKEIIEKNPTIINEQIEFGSGNFGTLLHIAVGYDNIFTTQLLLQKNAFVNSKTIDAHYTPLHMAHNKAIVKLLLKAGASLNKVDYRGASPLYHVLFRHGSIYNNYGLRYTKKINFDIHQRCNIAHYLLKSGANINQSVDNQTNSLLHCAVEHNDSKIASFLLHHGINIDHRNLDGKTALEKAIFNWFNRESVLKAFNNKGIICIYNHYWSDIFQLLKNNAQQFKEFVHPHSTSPQKVNVENIVAKLFMVAQHNKNNNLHDNKIIYDRHKGYCFKYTSCEDLEHWVGKEAIDYVKKYLYDRCQQALMFAKNNDYKSLKDLIRRYPYILSYDKQITFELLHHVMINGNEDIFAWLLQHNPDISGIADCNNDYNTLLHEAIVHKKAYAIELLIKNNISLTRWNTCSKSPIALLDKINNKNCIDSFNNAFADKFFSTYSYQPYYQEIKKCLKAGFNVNICDKNGNSLLLRAVKTHPEKCSLLLKNNASVTQEIIDNASSEVLRIKLQEKYNLNELIKAINENNITTCKTIIAKDPDVVNKEYAPNHSSFCFPLHIAVAINNITAAQLLLASKALINAQCRHLLYAPIHMVRSKKMLKLLLKYGASLHSKDCEEKTPLYHVLFTNFFFSKEGCLWLNDYQQCDLAHYLLKFGANINEPIDNENNSLLHRAIGYDCPEKINFLLNYNAHMEIKNKKGQTPIDKAILSTAPNAIKALYNKNILFLTYSISSFLFLKDCVKGLENIFFSSYYDIKKIEIGLAQLFMIAQRNKSDTIATDKIVEYNGYGYCFKNVSFKDLEEQFGKENIDYVKQYLHDQCQRVLFWVKNGKYNELNYLVQDYPYVLFYDKQLIFKLLENLLINKQTDTFSSLFLKDSLDISGVNENNGNTLLHLAITYSNAKAIELLIENNCSLTSYNALSKTPIDLLYSIKNEECIKSFHNAFADKFFSTYSYQPYYQEIKKLFKHCFFDVNICDKNGKSLLLRAVQSHPEKCSLLLKYGAIITQEIVDNACSIELRTKLQKKYEKQ